MNRHVTILLALALTFSLFMVYPLSYVLSRAFWSENGPTFEYFAVMLQGEYFREVILNSLNIALLVTLLSSIIAYPLAYVLARYRLPFSNGLHLLLLLPLVVPPFVGVLGLRQVLGKFGALNLTLLSGGIISAPISWLGSNHSTGVIILQALHLVPIMYLALRASLQNVHITLEESALVAGASPRTVFTKITLPLSIPGWFAGAVLVFIGSLTDVGTPLVFEYRHVIPVQIFNMLSDLHENRVGYSFVVFTCVLSGILFYLSQSASLYGVFAGSGRSREGQHRSSLASVPKILISAIILMYSGVTLLPHLGVVALSLSGRWFMTALPDAWTLDHYRDIFTHPLTVQSLTNSLLLSSVATVLTLFVGFSAAYLTLRADGFTRRFAELITLIPLAVPGIVFAFGYLGAFSGTVLDARINPFPLLVAAYMVRRTPTMVRSATAGLQEVSRTMEEAAEVCGATTGQIARTILFPLTTRHLLAGALLTFSYSMLEVSDGLLLAMEERYYPVSKAMYSLMGRPDGLELASALGVIVMLIMIATFYWAERLASIPSAKREVQ